MPYEWTTPKGPDAPMAVLHAWPYRSLPRRGFVFFIAATAGLVSIPLLALVGTKVLWGVLPFMIVVVGGIWIALERSYRDGSTLEELRIWRDRVTLDHHDPRAGTMSWEANPHWARLEMHRDHRIENYLTLRGGPREVELGAFLTPEERRALYTEVNARLDPL